MAFSHPLVYNMRRLAPAAVAAAAAAVLRNERKEHRPTQPAIDRRAPWRLSWPRPPWRTCSARPVRAEEAAPRTWEDLEQRMLARRMVLLTGGIDDARANTIVLRLLLLQMQDPQKPIVLLINSGGGQLYGGFAVYDAIRLLTAPVHTVCIGRAESMAAVLLASGEPGHRYVTPNCRVMIHQPSWSVDGKKHAADVDVEAAESNAAKARFTRALALCSGRGEAEVQKALERDHYMSPEEAVSFGIADRIASSAFDLFSGDHTAGSPGTKQQQQARPRK